MKNEQRYGGIIQAQMKDLGVLLPRGREGLGRWVRGNVEKARTRL